MNTKLAKMIDHTLLKPEATEEGVKQLCAEAREYGFASVCINPVQVKLAAKLLAGSGVKVCTVIGFPLGACVSAVKAFEAKTAVEQGAEEVDMVLNIGALKDKNYALVESDVREVVKASGKGIVVKVILENCLLDSDEITKACQLCEAAGADFVKTSTGFNKSGAKAEDIRTMKAAVGDRMKIKAAGGIRDYETAMAMIDAGAVRIGASKSIEIVNHE
ncbi:MAG: deoxyribose-phosphate aldolase [Clostridia bacterium]|nr:deoxyribose-phosphate aldolase [Clostridia bacterium]MDR3643803.1 deoxyribose-phosphate aldolase [Clostridia bacterium]